MLLRNILLLLLAILVVRVLRRALGRLLQGGAGGAASRDPRGSGQLPGIHMERDPVCGTFVVPERAIVLAGGSGRVFFCSTTCRDKYRARTA